MFFLQMLWLVCCKGNLFHRLLYLFYVVASCVSLWHSSRAIYRVVYTLFRTLFREF
jgi:hypothetical protein